MAERGMLYVISGPAGAGKSAIVKMLLKKHPDVQLSVSCTTREIRAGEIAGKSYHFVSDERFDELIEEGAFYEWAYVHQHRYGTLKSVVAQQLAEGSDLILEIDVQGCEQVLKLDPTAVGIFVCPPSRENLEKRLRGRGTETEESIRVRLGNVAGEVATAYKYQYVIIHQDWDDIPNALEIAAEEVYSIISAKNCEQAKAAAQKCELAERKAFLDKLSSDLKA